MRTSVSIIHLAVILLASNVNDVNCDVGKIKGE